MENGGIIWIFTRYTLPLTTNLLTQAGILKKSKLSERKGKEAGNKLYQQTILELARIKALKNQLLTLNLFSKYSTTECLRVCHFRKETLHFPEKLFLLSPILSNRMGLKERQFTTFTAFGHPQVQPCCEGTDVLKMSKVCDRLCLWLVESVSLPDPLADRIATRRRSGGEDHKSSGLVPDTRFLHVCSWWLWIGDHTSNEKDIFNFSPSYKQNSEKHTLKLFSQASSQAIWWKNWVKAPNLAW